MPELPDVQVYREYMDATSLHQRIERAAGVDADLVEGVSARTLVRRLQDRELAETRRHGKHLFAALDDGSGWLRLHFGMSGGLRYYKDGGDAPPRHTRLRLDFANGYHLAYVNVRRLGRIGWVEDVEAFVRERGLGPDALALDLDAFRARLEGRRGTVKGTLMNQSVIAGLGNIYVDEILLAAGVHPKARADRLKPGTLERLHGAMHDILRAAIDARVELDRFPEDFLLRRRAADSRCPRCGGPLRKETIAGRTTYYCPREQ